MNSPTFSQLALALDKELGGNPDFYNLPRKFKITITACPDWCSYPEINDIAFTAVRRPVAQAFRPEAFRTRSARPSSLTADPLPPLLRLPPLPTSASPSASPAASPPNPISP